MDARQSAEYWRKQFEVVQGQLEPLKFEVDERNRHVVTVHLIVKDLNGTLLVKKTVEQIFTLGMSLFEISGADPLTSDRLSDLPTSSVTFGPSPHPSNAISS
jgi:hypothetical protein